jgi:hypothetical protein
VHHEFLNGLVWRTIGASAAALLFLLSRQTRAQIAVNFRVPHAKTNIAFLLGKASGGISFVLINYAFAIGSIAIVNALTGIQHLFLFLFIIATGKKYPHLLREHLAGRALVQKMAGLVLMGVGISLLFL